MNGQESSAFGFGFDAEELNRWRDLITEDNRWAHLARNLKTHELAAIAISPRGAADASAGYWAAKEAVVKALGRRRAAGIREIDVMWDRSGNRIGIWRRGDRELACNVSVSYAGGFVFAVASLLGPGDETSKLEIDRPASTTDVMATSGGDVLREASDADQNAVRTWRNHPRVRSMSFTTHEIAEDEHWDWWTDLKDDPDRRMLIYEHEGEPAGVVTYELEENGVSASWGFYLDIDGLEARGDLLPAWFAIFQEGIDHAFDVLDVDRLHGEILVDNVAVLELHRRYGFVETARYERDVDGEQRETVHVELHENDRDAISGSSG